MPGMNEEIRQAVRDALAKKGLSQTKAAEQMGVDRVYVTRMLSGKAAGDAPKSWQKLLELAGLELTVKEKEG